jgi:tetratricopeptide (TPR) repeat protein
MLYRYAYELRNPYENGNEAMVNLLRQLPAGTTVRIWPPFMTYPPMFYVPGLHYCDQLTEKKAVREDLRRQLPDYVYVERTRPDVMFVPAAFLKKALEELQRRYGSKAYRVVKTLRPDWRYTSKPELPMHAFWRPGGSWFEHPGMVVLAAVGSPVENHRALAGGAIDAESVSNLGTALLTDGEIDMAESCFRQALQLDSTNAVAQCELGNALVKKDKTADAAEAAEHYRAAIRTNPRYVEAHVALGVALERLGHKADAAREELVALELDPDSASAHYNLAKVLADQGEVDKAIEHYTAALESQPNYAYAHVNLGTLLLQTGAVNEAIEHFQAAAHIQPDLIEAHLDLGQALAKIGEYDAAAAEFSLALTKLPPHSPLEPAIREMLKKLEK